MRKQNVTRPILPVCLLVAGQPCLVVGGGQVAERKVGHLIDAEADVIVVGTSLSEQLKALAEAGMIKVEARAFAASDVKGKCLVFATTDSKSVNQRVLTACRKHGVLCSAVDSLWPEGDFVTPAICRANGLVVTVSTGGRSCRQARVVKDRIAKMIASIADETAGDR
jgi:siroheme synthase-like protein